MTRKIPVPPGQFYKVITDLKQAGTHIVAIEVGKCAADWIVTVREPTLPKQPELPRLDLTDRA